MKIPFKALIASIAAFNLFCFWEHETPSLYSPYGGNSLFKYHNGEFNMHEIAHARRHNQTRKRRG